MSAGEYHSSMNGKKRDLSVDELKECNAVKAVLASFNAGKRRSEALSQSKIADYLGINQASVSSYLNGYNALNMKFAVAISELTGVGISEFSPRLALEMESIASAVEKFKDKESNVHAADFSRKRIAPGFVQIPQLDVRASMGLGALQPEHDTVIDTMTVSLDFLKQQRVSFSKPDNLALITGYGDSMEGTFSDGDVLLVDRSIDEVKVDAVYVLALKDELYIKRLQRKLDGTYLMISDNTKYQAITIEGQDLKRFQVLGRVVMAWNAKRM